MKAWALLTEIKNIKLKNEFNEHKQQNEKQKPKLWGIEKQRIKIIKAKSTLWWPRTPNRKTPILKELFFIFYSYL